MTNFDRWQLYNREVGAPQQYIDWGFYFLISSYLQRRVFAGPRHKPLFPNQYIIFCGDAGIGKGITIGSLAFFMTYFHKEQKDEQPTDNRARKVLKIPLLPMGSDAGSWQGLLEGLSDSYDIVPFLGWKTPGKVDNYSHSSVSFLLEELSSLFKKDTEDVTNFMIKCYDCGDYKYRTRSKQVEHVKSTCINFLAGTTPNFMRDSFDDKILTEGFSSRTIYVFADKNRFDTIIYPELAREQLVARNELLVHLRELFRVTGSVSYEQDAWAFLVDWYPKIRAGKIPRANPSPKLNDYYSRIGIHVQKLAMAMHFGETTDIREPITLRTIQKAIAFLATTEKLMSQALNFRATNPLANAGKRLLQYLANVKQANQDEIVKELWEYIKTEETLELLQTFKSIGKIRVEHVDGKPLYKLK